MLELLLKRTSYISARLWGSISLRHLIFFILTSGQATWSKDCLQMYISLLTKHFNPSKQKCNAIKTKLSIRGVNSLYFQPSTPKELCAKNTSIVVFYYYCARIKFRRSASFLESFNDKINQHLMKKYSNNNFSYPVTNTP